MVNISRVDLKKLGVSMPIKEKPKIKMFLDIPNAAELAGFSVRHFRYIIKEDKIPIVKIGRKFFILGRDFASWEQTQKPGQLAKMKTQNQPPRLY